MLRIRLLRLIIREEGELNINENNVNLLNVEYYMDILYTTDQLTVLLSEPHIFMNLGYEFNF